MKKIYPKKWLELHPYDRTDSVDQYYTRIANRIQECIYLTGIDRETEDEEDTQHISLCLAAWFEDVVSGTGIWQAFTTECRKRYGTCLPFYPIGDDYYPDEPNLEDVRFLLWHHMQFLRREKKRIVNPENSAIEQTATLIYNLLADEYETAPENERMQEYLLNQSFGKEDFFEYRAVLEWFHYCCYFNIENFAEYREEMNKLMEKDDEEELPQEYIELISLVAFSNLASGGRHSLLSLTTPEWLARILKNNDQPTDLLEKVKQREQSYYRYEGEDEKYMYLSDLCQNEEKLKVNKISMSQSDKNLTNLIVGETIFISTYVSYGDTWWQCGALVGGGQMNPQLEDLIQEQTKIFQRTFKKKTYSDFMRGSGGKPFVFCRTVADLQAFLTDKIGYKEAKRIPLPDDIVEDQGFLLTASPINGNCIITEELECIKSPDNPFYDKEIAEQRAFIFMLDPQFCAYDFSCILQDMNLLPDAKLNCAGEEHGHRILHDNAQFLTDYFHHCCREKDLPSEEESNAWKKKSSKGFLSFLK